MTVQIHLNVVSKVTDEQLLRQIAEGASAHFLATPPILEIKAVWENATVLQEVKEGEQVLTITSRR